MERTKRLERLTRWAAYGLILLGFSAVTTAADQPGLAPDDGMSAEERAEIYGDPGVQANARDVIIADATSRNIYFGMYRASMMTDPGWELFQRSVDWVNNFGDPATTDVWLATYNGSLDPDFSAERDGIAVYNYLIDTMGFDKSRIHVDHQSSIETGDFTGYDIVIYAWVYPRDATNVVNQGVPFLTFSSGETDELGIGTGVETMHEFRDNAYVINDHHHVTSTLGLGQFYLSEGMWMDATVASGNGIVLVSADGYCLQLNVSNLVAGAHAVFRATGASDGSTVAIVYGFDEGLTEVNNYLGYCATFNIAGVTPKRVVAIGPIRSGAFTIRRPVPPGFAGTDILFQAALRGTCPDECMSNLVIRTIQ